MFTYFSTHRPAGPGACPVAGLVNVTALDPADVVPQLGRGAWSRLDYSRQLTPEEVQRYELTPAAVAVMLTPAAAALLRRILEEAAPDMNDADNENGLAAWDALAACPC